MKIRPLVQFDVSYYRYPNNLGTGYWSRYPIALELDQHQKEGRQRWIEEVSKLSNSTFHDMITESFADPSDYELLRQILLQHGIFAQKFFHRALRERVARRFAEVEVELEKFGKLLSEAWGYETDTRSDADAIYRIINHVYEQVLLHAINDSRIYRQIEEWFTKFARPKKCSLCHRPFKVIDLPYWVYFGSNGCQDCCFSCPILMAPKKGELVSLVPAFIESCAFIPNSDANPINYSFTSRLSINTKVEAFQAFARMGGVEHVKRKFGSWFKALVESGTLPDGVLSTARGVRCLARDGHVCHSLEEQHIDNWFAAHGIPHEREPSYPAHPELNHSGRRRADWRVGDSFIEYFGLVGDPKYEKKMDEKILLAQRLRIDLIALYPSDLAQLGSRLDKLVANPR